LSFRFLRRGAIALAALAAIVVAAPATEPAAQDVLPEIKQRSDELDVPFVPSDDNVLNAMFDMAKPTSGDFLIDLGSGDGRIVVEAARRFGLRGFGVDLNEGLVAIARQRARSVGVADRVEFHIRDLFRTDFRQASILTMYLLPEIVLELREALLRDLRPGARIVSHDYHMGEWRPDEARLVRIGSGNEESVVYFWTVPAKAAGTWEWTIDSRDYADIPVDFRAVLGQRYQDIAAEVVIFPGLGVAHDLRLSGARIAFSITGEVNERMVRHDFAGTIDGDRIAGAVTLGGASPPLTLPWAARRKAAD
jgi:hypothetical protein